MNRDRGILVYPLKKESIPAWFGWNCAIGINMHTLEVRMILTEGVSYYIGPKHPWQWDDAESAKEYSLSEVLNMIDLTRKPVDLADWVRTFGDRLESNFWIQFGALTTRKPRLNKHNRDKAYAIIVAWWNSDAVKAYVGENWKPLNV